MLITAFIFLFMYPCHVMFGYYKAKFVTLLASGSMDLRYRKNTISQFQPQLCEITDNFVITERDYMGNATCSFLLVLKIANAEGTQSINIIQCIY